MNKNLLCNLLLLSVYLFCNNLFAQTDRIENAPQKQTIEVSTTSIVKSAPNNIPEKTNHTVLNFTNKNLQSVDSLKSNATPANSKFVSKPVDTDVTTSKSQKKVRKLDEAETTLDNKVDINEPLFPELKVIATKEESYENKTVSTEKQSQQLQNIKQPLTEDNISTERITPSTQITISPLKRKYLEGIVSDIEKEIQASSDKNTIDVQAKKKELNDLKELLAK